MPFTYQIEADGYIVRVTGTEQGNVQSARGTFSDVLADPQLHRPFGLLVDVRSLNNLPNQEEIHSLALFARERAEHVAALVVNHGVQFGVARMIQVLAELQGAHIKVFTEELMAQLWLRNQLHLSS